MKEAEKEIWKPIKNFLYYEVSNLGRVKSYKSHQKEPYISKGSANLQGYIRATLTKQGKVYQILMHRLVLETFIGPCPNGCEANHKDGIKSNCKSSNLEWITHYENFVHALKLGLYSRSGEKNTNAKLIEKDILEIRRLADLGINWHTIARNFSVTRANIYRVVNRLSWRHI